MVTLTAEQLEEIRGAGDEPIRIEDPETRATYVLLRAKVYDGLRLPPAPECEDLVSPEIPEGLRRAKEAFLRDLPGLLERKRLHGRWALYHLEKRIGIWRDPQRMPRKSIKLSLPEDEIYYGVIDPHPEEPEDVETSLFEFEEIEPSP
jgi:hypothetical protein